MAWSEKHLPHKNEDLCSDPLSPRKKRGAVVHANNPDNDDSGNRDRWIPGNTRLVPSSVVLNLCIMTAVGVK